MRFQLVLWSEQATDQNPGNAVQQTSKPGILHHQFCSSPCSVLIANPFSPTDLCLVKEKRIVISSKHNKCACQSHLLTSRFPKLTMPFHRWKEAEFRVRQKNSEYGINKLFS